ncbi:MAG: Holliday junction branch migration protein RuvA [Clostridia bacterium]|nr:Holliday junction branch migration protein RuvA [Clostridia bacterium]
MFDYIKGTLNHVESDFIVVENQGIGYKIATSTPSISDFSSPGEAVVVYTEMIVREDLIALVGFSTRDELHMFQLLTAVSGVGTKVAIGILSSIPFTQLAFIIGTGDIKALTSAHGVGKKTAERIVLELKDKVAKLGHVGLDSIDTPTLVGDQGDALAALVTLGYTKSEAQGVIKSMDLAGMSVEDIIKSALRKLMTQ